MNITEKANLFSYLRVEMTYHSNSIEGVSLNFNETKKLLEEGITAPNKPLSDHLVIIGFSKAYDEILRTSHQKLDSNYIKDIHTLLFDEALRVCPDKIDRPIGAYRYDERSIKGANIDLSSPKTISNDLENLLYQDNPKSIEEIADFHIKFERIHPFSDGNGRVGRLLITKQFLENNLIPPLIKVEFRDNYLKAMNDKTELAEFLKSADYLKES